MLTRTQAEWALVLSLLRRDGETAEAPLDRLDSLTPVPEPEDFKNSKTRSIYALILKYARRERSITPKLAALHCGVGEDTLLEKAEQVDTEYIRLYAEAVVEFGRGSKIASAAEQAANLARSGRAREALDELTEQVTALALAREDELVVPLDTATERFLDWYERFQKEIKSGQTRLSLMLAPLDEMIPYIFPGHSILVTAGTKVGKSAFVQQMFDYNLARGLRGLLFHFEDSPQVVGLRRTLRHMISEPDADGITMHKMLTSVLSSRELEIVARVNGRILRWAGNGTQVYCAGWTMEQVCRTAWRLRDKYDFMVIDYLNKAVLSAGKLRNYGQFGGRGQDAELIKTTAERLGKVAIVVQQENDQGLPYQTRESAQKFQAWISLSRERLADQSLSEDGKVWVRNANLGKTGEFYARFFTRNLVWAA